MLLNLQIKNFLLIEHLEIEFNEGLTVITGETGSGKSIIIDGLMLVFGARANPNMIRLGQTSAIFSASFSIENFDIQNWLEEKGFISDVGSNSLICRRVIDINGKSKAQINGVAASIGELKYLGDKLLAIHAQHAAMALLNSDGQRNILDQFAGVADQVLNLQQLFNQINLLQKQLHRAEQLNQDLLFKRDLLQEKVSIIEELNIQGHEWAELQIKHKQLANANFITQELELARNLMDHDEYSLNRLCNLLSNSLAKLHEFLPNKQQIQNLIQSIDVELSELSHELDLAASQIELDPHLLAQVEERIGQIYTTARKLNLLPEGLLEQLKIWQDELISLGNDLDLQALTEQLANAKQQYLLLAEQISTSRGDFAQELTIKVNHLLKQLSIGGEFAIEITRSEQWFSYGIDNINYQASFNLGMPAKSLGRVVSGGELSRVALALYVALGANSQPQLIIFDEIDVGIGGGVAHSVGKLLKSLGSTKQVICITHQPQTACAGDFQLSVSKFNTANLTTTKINYVAADSRITEIARMLSGNKITETTFNHAREMLSGAI